MLAKSKDLKTAFGTDVVDDVCKIILAKGDLQVSDKEREAFQERYACMCTTFPLLPAIAVQSVCPSFLHLFFFVRPSFSGCLSALAILSIFLCVYLFVLVGN